ncbi:MAG TPA: type VI secretion system baseplate subunit TssK [Bryobacteraceae bacterium]
MKGLQPVIWSKGTFLTPQHLQAQDRFIENTLRFQMEALSFRPWGFESLELEQHSLAAGVIGISRARGIFADGLLFDIPDSDLAPAPKALSDLFEVDENSIDVFLGIPHYRDQGVNVASSQVNVDARFRAEVSLMRDENTGLAEKPVRVASKNLRLLVRKEVREGTAALQIARVNRTRDGLYQLDPYFIPPSLNYAASEYLVSILRRLIEILSAKSSELSAARRQKNRSLASFTASDIPNFWLLYTINSAFPALFHLFSLKQGHPERLYAAMLSLAGALTTFSTTIHPKDLPKYDHENLTFCFSDLDGKIRELLETVVPSNFIALPLTLTQPPSIYATSLEQDKYLKNTRLYLAVNAEMKAADLVDRAPLLIKVASAAHIDMLVRQAIKGVQLTYVPSPPASIPVKMNYHYFSLSQSGGAWESIVRARNFAAYVPGDFPNPQLELIILFPQAG